MQNIKVGRYDDRARIVERDGTTRPLSDEWSGWIEDKTATWIIFLDGTGKPAVYWPERDKNGGTVGEPVKLST